MKRIIVGVPGVLALAVTGVAVLTLLSAQGGDPPESVTLVGLSDEVLTDAGVGTDLILSVADGDKPTLSADEAETAAVQAFPGTSSRQTVLAEMRQGDDGSRLVWVINVDPASLTAGGFAGPNDIYLMWLNVVDAKTGEWLFARSSVVNCAETPDDARCVERGLPTYPETTSDTGQ